MAEADVYLGLVNSDSSQGEYYNPEEFNLLLDDLNETASIMKIEDAVFTNKAAAEGTNAMELLNQKLDQVQQMTNRYKTFMTVDVSGLITDCTTNIQTADSISGDAIDVAN